MRKTVRLVPEFVERIPERLEERVLYISIPYATAMHLCACGCGHEVVTPLSPTDWEMTFDGETVSISPSIGNWSLACQSHYWIKRSLARWARRMSQEEIERGRERERRRRAERYGMLREAELWSRSGPASPPDADGDGPSAESRPEGLRHRR